LRNAGTFFRSDSPQRAGLLLFRAGTNAAPGERSGMRFWHGNSLLDRNLGQRARQGHAVCLTDGRHWQHHLHRSAWLIQRRSSAVLSIADGRVARMIGAAFMSRHAGTELIITLSPRPGQNVSGTTSFLRCTVAKTPSLLAKPAATPAA
jgi:hypothetical protein